MELSVWRGGPPRRDIMRIREPDGHGRRGRVAGCRFCQCRRRRSCGQRAVQGCQRQGDGRRRPGADPEAASLIKLQLKGAPPGERAFHIHAVGKCEAPFESAGPHFNPGNHKHGMLAGHGHAGDMPNLHVPQSGDLSVEVLNAAVTLEKGKPNSLFDNDGSTLIIHARADDYKSDPAGNAGGRIACGVIQPSSTGS